MLVHVLFFGRIKEIVGRAEDEADMPAGTVVEDVFRRYASKYPALSDFRRSVVASLNQEFAGWESPLAAGDEVAFLPPVSGGSGAGLQIAPSLFELVRQPISVAAIVAGLKAPEDGAVAIFEGIVRNNSRGSTTLYLDYEAYEPMALAKLREIGGVMRAQFAINRLALVHRLGRLEIGETSVLIGVSSAHRREAFDACRFGIDTLKHTVPIWKKEYFEDGAVWADGELPGPPSNLLPPESK